MADKKTNMNKELGGRAPRKTQINLIKKEVKTVDIGKRIVTITIVLAILAVVSGYTYMRWQTIRGLARQTVQLSEELESMKLISATYDDIYAEYVRYSTAYETMAEHRTQDGRRLVDKARELIEPYGFITDISINGNTMQIKVYCEDVAKVTESLNNDPEGLVLMVIPRTEIRPETSVVSGTETVEGVPGETDETGEAGETGQPLTGPGGEQFEFYSKELGTRVLVESINTFDLIFADKEG